MSNETQQHEFSLEFQIKILKIELQTALYQVEHERKMKEEYRRLFNEANELLNKS